MNIMKFFCKFFNNGKNEEYNLSDRMTELIKKHNNKSVYYYTSCIISLKSRKLLYYVNKMSTADEKLHFYKKYNELLIKVCEKTYSYFDPSCIYTFNNEIHIVYNYDANLGYMFNGNINKLLTSIASYVGIQMNNELQKQNVDLPDLFFDGIILEFTKNEEMLNYLIWRQHDCYRNSLSNVYACYKNGDLLNYKLNKNVLNNIKLETIEKELFEKYEISENVLYGMLIKKEIYYKENETDKYEMIKRKKYTVVSKDLSLEFVSNMKSYIKNKLL